MAQNRPSKNARYIKVLSTQYRPILWFFAVVLLVLALLSARAAWLQPDPVLRLVLGWAALILFLPALPIAFIQQQCWLDVERQQF